MLISLLIKFDNASKATAEVGGCGHTDNARGTGQKYNEGRGLHCTFFIFYQTTRSCAVLANIYKNSPFSIVPWLTLKLGGGGGLGCPKKTKMSKIITFTPSNIIIMHRMTPHKISKSYLISFNQTWV